jgi:hypothetical protein
MISFTAGATLAALIVHHYHRHRQASSDNGVKTSSDCSKNGKDGHDGHGDLATGEKTIAMKLKHLDQFLRWTCGLDLLEMGLFPNAQEVTESMACVAAVEVLQILFSQSAFATIEILMFVIVGAFESGRAAF